MTTLLPLLLSQCFVHLNAGRGRKPFQTGRTGAWLIGEEEDLLWRVDKEKPETSRNVWE